jgi:hypothetical protein
MNQIVRGSTACFVSDRWGAFGPISLQQPEHLPLCDVQHVRAVLNAQPSVINLRQNLYAI